jgi:polysaccharide pyruvyl transferase WcaK-like protein
MLMKVFVGRRMRELLTKRNLLLKTIVEADMVADITGGDSFSDIYGMRRFITGFLRKWAITVLGKKLVLLPQTYGPFDKRLTRVLARYIINRATLVYSRDRKGLDDVGALLGAGKCDGKIRFVPDVGFLLDPHRPQSEEMQSLEKIKDSSGTLVGLNISGLLSCSSDTGDNMFNLKIDYPALIDSIVEFLMQQEGAAVLLVPHVVSARKGDAPPRKSVARKRYREQSDSVACERLYDRMAEKHPGRIFIVRGRYNHNETKYIIGLCDFFIGSRMHACIAALSQGIPAVGVAYSGKFHGVFESVGVENCVADARRFDEDELLEKISSAYRGMGHVRENLHESVARAQREVLDMFKTLEL